MANQTVNLPSRTLMGRLASCRVVLWALDTHGPRLVEIVNGPFGQTLPVRLPALFEPLLTLLTEVLNEARDLLIVRDRKLRDQKAKATHYRRTRDAEFSALGDHVVGLRAIFRGAHGPDTVEELGFALRTPQLPGELFEQAEHLTARLSESDLVLPESKFKNLDLDPASLAEEMQPLVTRLGQSLEDVSREERLVDAAKIAKDEAVQAYDRTFLWGARTAESLFRLADLPEVAKRVRPSIRRPGLTTEVAAEEPDDVSSEDSEAAAEDDAPEASFEDRSPDPSDAE